MIITCTSCANRFKVDEGLIGPEGRQVRCTVCYYTWKQLPGIPKVPPLINLDEQTDFVAPRAFPKKRFRWVGFVLLFALLAVAINVLVFGRDRIVVLWPEAEVIYRVLGLSAAAPGAGLALSNIIPHIQAKGAVEMIVVEGDVTNTSPQIREVDSLTISIIGEKGTLDHWEHHLPKTTLYPGEYVHFETAPRPKAAGGKTVAVDF